MSTPPRRLSVDDADYDPAIGAQVLVFLDGVDQGGRCCSYDVDAGTVFRAKLNEAGELYCVGDKVAMETVTGKVEVRWRG